MEYIQEFELGPNGQYFHTYADNYLEKHAEHQTMDDTLVDLCDFLNNYNAAGTYTVESYLKDHIYNFLICFEGEKPFNYMITDFTKEYLGYDI